MRSSSKISSRRPIGELVAGAEPLREVADDPPVLARALWRAHDLPVMDDPALDVGRRPFVLLHQRAGKDDVGVARRFGHEEVDDGEELEPAERFADEVAVRQRHRGVEADQQQALDPPVVNRFQERHRRQTRVRDRGFLDAPDAGDVLAMCRDSRCRARPAADRTSGPARVRPGRCPGR